MTRVTLVLNEHGATSETFQRGLAVTLAEGGYDVTVHALGGTLPTAAPPHPRITFSVGGAGGGTMAASRGALRGGPGALARAARSARHRYGWSPRAARAAADAGPILATRPDIVHIGFSGIGVALEDVWPLLGDVPLVVSCRGSGELIQPLLDPDRAPALGRLFARTAIVHVVAAAVGEVVVGFGADPARVRVVRPAVDLDRWPMRTPPETGGPWRLVSVGRLLPAKGLDDLFAAVAIVRERGLDVTLTVVGDGPHRPALVLRAARSGLDDIVDLVGARPPAEVAETLAGAHLAVSPSWSEGINNGVLEAMASGVPVVSTRVGGMAEVITDGVDGWLVDACRPDALADAIERALGAPDGLAAVAARARSRVESSFAATRQQAEWLDIYRGLAGGPSPAAQEDLAS